MHFSACKSHINACFKTAYLCIFGLRISAYFVHIYAYGIFAYICIFVCAYFSIFYLIMHIYCIFLFCLFPHIPAYLILHIAAYFLHIFAYLNLHIMGYLPVCIVKHITHIFACKMQIYSYFEKVYLCIFCFANLYILLRIYAFIFGIFEHNFASEAKQFYHQL